MTIVPGLGYSAELPDSDMKHGITFHKDDGVPRYTPAKDFAPRNAKKDDQWIDTLGYPVLQKK